jgi:hypothetical protein
MVEGDVIDPQTLYPILKQYPALPFPRNITHHQKTDMRAKKNNQTYCKQLHTLLKSQWRLMLLCPAQF